MLSRDAYGYVCLVSSCCLSAAMGQLLWRAAFGPRIDIVGAVMPPVVTVVGYFVAPPCIRAYLRRRGDR